ncbi:hypothetical protein [Candidatus Methanoliparum sp. LAM-1]
MQNLDNFICYLAYAGGYAMGNFTGIIIEKDWPLGNSYRDNYTKEC